LGVLFKYNSNDRLVEYNIQIIDDVLRILDGQGNDFVYDKTNVLSQKVQETIFNEKRILIEECLFGVDLNTKAVHICNLRLWIELLKNAYYHNGVMETLPNIDINIRSGNSLISKMPFLAGKEIGKGLVLDKEEKNLINQYREQVKNYKSVSIKDDKKKIVETIKKLKNKLYKIGNKITMFDDDEEVYKDKFEWAWEFPEILTEDGVFLGFDIIIGNPPYIQLQSSSMKEQIKYLKEMNYKVYNNMGDIYCLFYERVLNLIGDDGIISLITSNKWMRAGYGEVLRNFLAFKTNPICLIDFAGIKIFDSATVDVNILTYENADNKGQTKSCIIKNKDCLDNLSEYIEQHSVKCSFVPSGSWTILSSIEQRIKSKIEAAGTPLKDWDIQINYGIKTGLNEAFIISGEKKDELIASDPKSAEIIRPILRGKDIKRYSYTFADLWLINTHNGIPAKNIPSVDVKQYPAIKAHLEQFYIGLERRLDKGNTPYNLRSCAYMDDFSKQKIVWGNLCLNSQYALADEQYFISAPATMIVPGNKFLLAVLNSPISDFYIRNLGVTRNGGYFEYKPMFVEKLPVFYPSNEIKMEIEKLVDIQDYDKINKLLYEVYEILSDEINFIESQ